jgi:hypothetical protein
MATLLRIDPETLPRTLALDPPVTDAEFEALCRENSAHIRLERTKEGIVRMNPPTGDLQAAEIRRLHGKWATGGWITDAVAFSIRTQLSIYRMARF